MHKISWWIAAALILSACGSTGGSKGTGGDADGGTAGDTGGPIVSLPVVLKCADATNASTSAACSAAPLAFVRTDVIAPTVIETGDVSRGALIHGIADAENANAMPRVAYIEMTFDGGCNGAATWPIITRQPFTVPALDTTTFDAGGQCSDMPLGQRVLAVNLYDDDGETLIDAFEVQFNLIE